MQVFAHAFWVPKAGNSETEYEDAFWPREPLDAHGACFRFAVADGATESSFARIWAVQLVRAFCKGCLDEATLSAQLPEMQQRWSAIVRRRPLPWYADENVRSGAFAAILGLVLRQTPDAVARGEWRAMAIGDSCVAQVRVESVLALFPLDRSESFTNRPHLLSSNPVHNEGALEQLRATEGTWMSGDAFYLMTDALACWFMREVEEGRSPWHVLHHLETTDQVRPFREWIGDLRRDGAIRNDDVTLLRVDIA